jgi:hypothetical protein
MAAEDEAAEDDDSSSAAGESGPGRFLELRCVLAVVRHGDRTPKQKMKMPVSQVGPLWAGGGWPGGVLITLGVPPLLHPRTFSNPPLPPPASRAPP